LAGKWKRHPQDRLERLAKSIEAIEERDRQMVDESSQVDKLREEGAAALYALCREFVNDLNRRLPEPALLLDPPEWTPESFHESGPNLIQISLRGRLLQLEYEATDEPSAQRIFGIAMFCGGTSGRSTRIFWSTIRWMSSRFSTVPAMTAPRVLRGISSKCARTGRARFRWIIWRRNWKGSCNRFVALILRRSCGE